MNTINSIPLTSIINSTTMNQHTGLLIAIEGIDGSGKSTLAANLAHELTEMLYPVVLTREPGATPLGKLLRSIVQEKQVPIGSRAEFLLFAADRAQHFEQLVIPALTQGKIVISDRMSDSSIAYQGYGRGLDISFIKTINQWTMQGIASHITVYVKVTPEIAFERIRARKKELTSFEQEAYSFTQKLVYGFDSLYAGRSDVIILEGTLSPHELTQLAVQGIINRINKA